MKFRKKPVVIEAIQWLGTNADEVFDFCGGIGNPHMFWGHDKGLKLHTLEGPLSASAGDWIIKGVKGEFYPCKPDIFEATYERVD